MTTTLKKRYLALDIDGVLNNHHTMHVKPIAEFHSSINAGKPFVRSGMNFADECIEALRVLVAESTHIVIVSMWRYGAEREHFVELFSLYDIHLSPEQIIFIDQTVYDGSPGVRSWLLHSLIEYEKPDSFTVIDDTSSHYTVLRERLVLTDPVVGLTLRDVEAALTHLRTKYEPPQET